MIAAHGSYRIRILLPGLLAFACLLAAGCGGEESSAQPQRAAGGPREEKPAVPVAVTNARRGDIASYYEATGTLAAEKEAQVLARVSGVVKRIAVEEGDAVAAGGLLLEIEGGEYRLRAEQARARAANLRTRQARIETMHASGGISLEEFQAAASELAVAEAEEGLAELDLSYTRVKAPFAGSIVARLVDVGQTLSAGTPLFDLADFRPLLAEVHVPSRELGKLRADQAVELQLDSSGERLRGTIKLISPVIDPSSGTIKLTVEVADYPPGTRPGDFAAVRIVTERHEDTVLVPRGAVLTEKGESFLFAVTESGDGPPRAERRVVTLGFDDDRDAEILSGLESGERVVVKGQRSLEHGSALKLLEVVPAGADS